MSALPSKEAFKKLVNEINSTADAIGAKLQRQSEIISKTSAKVQDINAALNAKKLALEEQMTKAIKEGNNAAYAALEKNYEQLQAIQGKINNINSQEVISNDKAQLMENTLDAVLRGINELGVKPEDLPQVSTSPAEQRPGTQPQNWQQQQQMSSSGRGVTGMRQLTPNERANPSLALRPGHLRPTQGGRRTKRRRKRGGYTYKKSPTRKLVTKSKRRRKHRSPTKRR